ncbi:hypothetical protein CS022_16940 [Veronia nyctiphanis]|uniref:Uncharacterized protein n=1 Tax=Veronia nyctiphanis TaxID=1278244 RepID=A0A4Q0YP08_9GAMM|nr:hypothetical protein [Veronia nyctiphanis]RXJ72233.1 hypothetical protein CS022_16940 [Veronia nyctiphanis]
MLFTFLLALTLAYAFRLKKLEKHIAQNHCQEWARISNREEGMESGLLRFVSLNESIKRGYLHQQDDAEIRLFIRIERFMTIAASVAIISYLVSLVLK